MRTCLSSVGVWSALMLAVSSFGSVGALLHPQQGHDGTPPDDGVRRFKLFFQPRGHDVLDRVLLEAPRHQAPYLTKDEVRDASGISQQELKIIEDAINSIDGRVTRVATLGTWIDVEFAGKDVNVDSSLIMETLKNYPDGDGIHEEVAYIHFQDGDNSKRRLSPVKNDPGQEKHRILQSNSTDGPGIEFFHLPRSMTLAALGLSEADAISQLAAWLAPIHFMVLCSNGTTEAESTGDCLNALALYLTPKYINESKEPTANETVVFEDLTSLRRTCAEIGLIGEWSDDTYIYTLPASNFKPNVLYGEVIIDSSIDGIQEVQEVPTYENRVLNYFNASVASFRDLYGVDPKYKGREDLIQGTSLSADGLSAINVTALNEYLALQNINHSEINLYIYAEAQENNCDGTDDVQDCGGETMLDVQTMQGMAPLASTYFAPGNDVDDFTVAWHDYFDAIVATNPHPDVISYSWSELMDAELLDSADHKLKQLAGMGITILLASGDAGAGGNGGGPCYDDLLDSDGFGGPLIGNSIVEVWPTISEWVTAVGGTQMLVAEEGAEAKEVVCSSATNGDITSGGGFAGTGFEPLSLYSTPSWQKAHVDKYLQKNGPDTFPGFPTTDTPGFNPNGRGFPDISGYAARFPILDYDGSLNAVAGTSLAAPLVASIFTLANQALTEAGYAKIGYANPMLYWIAESCPEAFNDITIGSIQSNKIGEDCEYGYPAAEGWDAATGLGTIKFEPFVQCAKKYQDVHNGNTTTPQGGNNSTDAKDSNSPRDDPGTEQGQEDSASTTSGAVSVFHSLTTSFAFRSALLGFALWMTGGI